jgi:hypothetical protein
MISDTHISDEELIADLNGELVNARTAVVAAHLRKCWQCRGRRRQLEDAATEFVRLRHARLDSLIGPSPGPEARLKAALSDLHVVNRSLLRSRPLVTAAVLGMAAIGFVIFAALRIAERPAMAAALPNSRLTPGATRLIKREQVCAIDLSADAREIPVQLALQVFQEYGIRKPRPRAYEVDYLITPALGGADDIRNLWPQPYSGVWTAQIKDALEDHLRTLVCSGQLDLATAQEEIATNWIAAYRKYFRTQRPLPAHTLFLKDRPWE